MPREDGLTRFYVKPVMPKQNAAGVRVTENTCTKHRTAQINRSEQATDLFTFTKKFVMSAHLTLFYEQLQVTVILLLYCASILSLFLKRSAVLYLSSPLHCNHWLAPVGHHGWPSCVF